MAQKKAHEVDSWLARPDGAIRFVLIYGPDRGLVAERAAAFAAAAGFSADDPFSVLRLDAAEIAGDPGRLPDELAAIPMFGGRRLVWLRGASGGKELADIVTRIAARPPAEACLLIEAGDLKKGAPLRSAFEAAGSAMALPCYGDDSRAVERLLDDSLSAAGMTIGLEARQAFRNMLGGDRLATRGEIEKLLLYCHGRDRIEVADVMASAGDVSSLSLDSVVDRVLSGEAAGFDRDFARALAAGSGPFTILAAMMRQMQQLQVLRHRMERGRETATAVVGTARPPVFFSRRPVITRALSAWNGQALARALERLQDAVMETRTGGALAAASCHRVLLSLCLESARLARAAAG
jgi:DNA polymerase-3 subunit delta